MDADRQTIVNALKQVEKENLFNELNIDPTNFSWSILKRVGQVAKSWGQVPKEERERINRYLATQLRKQLSHQDIRASGFEDFLKW